jgi:hypothetical protein
MLYISIIPIVLRENEREKIHTHRQRTLFDRSNYLKLRNQIHQRRSHRESPCFMNSSYCISTTVFSANNNVII